MMTAEYLKDSKIVQHSAATDTEVGGAVPLGVRLGAGRCAVMFPQNSVPRRLIPVNNSLRAACRSGRGLSTASLTGFRVQQNLTKEKELI
jgi:hypothetical protein